MTRLTTRTFLSPGATEAKIEPLPVGDLEMCAWICANLTVPAVCDTLDSLGCRNQAMHQRLRPLDASNCTFAGRARTLHWVEMKEPSHDSYDIEIRAMDSLRPGDIVVHSTDDRQTNAPWGELMTTAARRRGVVGCICDSLIRDCERIQDMGFPVFHAGVRPVDSNGRGKVIAFDVPISCGNVGVSPGDLIFANFDGVVVIPKLLEEKVLPLALERISKEQSARTDLIKGLSLREVFDKYRVL